MRNDFVGSTPRLSAGRPPRKARSTSDEALIEKIASGNRLAMQALFIRHQARIYRFILRLVRDATLAEDLTSDVFLTVWQQAHRFEARSSATTWLLAIARYKTYAELRRRTEPLPDDGAAQASDDPADNPEAVLEIKRRGEILRRCLTHLSREHREIIDLVYYHEKSVQEVAGIVGIPGNTVKTRLFYARRRLSELLEAEGIVGALS
jgi:RNA polymerase sigma-70 factor (ECF subfamily)